MELYDATSYELSERLTKRYSTSFSLSTQLLPKTHRAHIYAIYGLVRIADEIVDTYHGDGARLELDRLEEDVYRAIEASYSPNPIVHAFSRTANKFAINKELIEPFFASMRIDLEPQQYTDDLYETYIHGSAEVVGLMCLKVFLRGDTTRYDELRDGACALGSAYQKVNFLRDLKTDYHELGRLYFPGVQFENFSEDQKLAIIRDITHDFVTAKKAIGELPRDVQPAVRTSYQYYTRLLKKLHQASVDDVKSRRIRVSDTQKVTLYLRARARV